MTSCYSSNVYYNSIKKMHPTKEVFTIKQTGKPFIVSDTTKREIWLYQISTQSLDSLLISKW